MEQYGLPDKAFGQLLSILQSLAGEHAPTAVKAPGEAVDVHIADSLSGLETVKEANHERIADIGSGCGIPGLVLAVALPGSEVIAVEAQRRKCEFVEEAAAAAGLDNVRSAWSRAEEWHDGFNTCDVVTARALADLPVVMEYAAPLLGLGGRMVAWKGKLDDGELERGLKASAVLNLTAPQVAEVKPWGAGGVRRLVICERDGDLPEVFPRRAGIATKRPLGS